MRPVRRRTDADSAGNRNRVIVRAPAGEESQGRVGQIVPVERIRHAQRLCHSAGTRCQRPSAAATIRHDLRAQEGCGTAEEHGLAHSGGAGDDVQAPMDPIAPVYVRPTGFTEHGAVTPRDARTGGGVRGRVFGASVCLGFDDVCHGPMPIDVRDETSAQELPSHDDHRLKEETLGKARRLELCGEDRSPRQTRPNQSRPPRFDETLRS